MCVHQALRRFIKPKNAPRSIDLGSVRGNHTGHRPSRLAKLQGTKSAAALHSNSLESIGGHSAAFTEDTLYTYDSVRPASAAWKPKKYSWERDLAARWPYLC